MVTGSSIDNLTSYHPQRWGSKSVPNSGVEHTTAKTTGEAVSFHQSHGASESALLIVLWNTRGLWLPKKPRQGSLQPSARVHDEHGEQWRQATRTEQLPVKVDLSAFAYQTKVSAEDRKPRCASFPNCPLRREALGIQVLGMLCHGEHRQNACSQLAWRSAARCKLLHNTQEIPFPSSFFSNWKQLAHPVSTQDQNTN